MLEPGPANATLELELDRQLARAHVTSSLFGTAREAVRLGRFELLRCIGRGAMGTVYEARHGGRVALKLLSRVDAKGVYRLKREFRSLAGISHPSLISLGSQKTALEIRDGLRFFGCRGDSRA